MYKYIGGNQVMVPVNSVQMKSPLRSVDQQHTGITGRSSLTTSPVVIRTQTGSLTANPVVSVCSIFLFSRIL